MKRTLVLPVLATVVLIGIIAGCKRPAQEEKVTGQTETLGLAHVKVVKAVRQRVSEKLVYTGTVEPWQRVNITPEMGGKVSRIYIDEGDRVAAGQLLAELDTESTRLQLKQAEAGAAVAEANFVDAKRNMERMERLFNEKAVSDQQFEKVKLGYEAAAAQREQAQAALNLARHALDVSIMKAPFGGIIASRNAEVGDVINPMMGSFSPTSGVVTLMDMSRIKIAIQVTASDIARIRKGQPATVRTPSLAGQEFQGTISVVNVVADPMTKKFGVEVTVPNGQGLLRPNTFGDVMLEVSTHENALAVPQKAILDNRYLFVVENGKAVRRDVTLGLQNTTRVEVTDGLQEGEVVIVEGNYGLEDGSPVQVEEEVEK